MPRFGEMKCLLENRLGILGAEYRRIDYEVEELEKQIVADENALGRITDADIQKRLQITQRIIKNETCF